MCWLCGLGPLGLSLVFPSEPLQIGGIDFTAKGYPSPSGQPVTAGVPRLWWCAATGQGCPYNLGARGLPAAWCS